MNAPDPTPPTPRAVLARAFTNELKRMLGDDPLPDGKPPFVYVGPESDLVLAVERDYLAALAASAGPLSAEVVQGLRRTLLTADGQGVSVKTDAFALLYGAYTALAADLAALRATTNDILNHFTRYGHPGQDSVETGWIPVGVVKRWRELARTPTPEGQG